MIGMPPVGAIYKGKWILQVNSFLRQPFPTAKSPFYPMI